MVRKEIYLLESTVVTVSYLVHYDVLLQYATDNITKCYSYFITNCDKFLLQNVSSFLLRNTTVLVQNATIIQNASILFQKTTDITKRDNYYIIRWCK